MGQRVEKGNHNELSGVFKKAVIVIQENIFQGLISYCNNLSHTKALEHRVVWLELLVWLFVFQARLPCHLTSISFVFSY